MSSNRLTNLMPDKAPTAAVAQAGPFRAMFAIGSNDRRTGVFVSGLTSGQTVPVKVVINPNMDDFSDPTSIQTADMMQVRSDGIDIAFTPDDNLKAFEVPGVYVLDVPSGATVTVGAFK